MGNTGSEKKRENQNNATIGKKLNEVQKRSEKIVTVLIMGKGTVNFLNALQCIRDSGINQELRLECKPYIYHEMIFELKFLIQKCVENETQIWSSNLYKHCVTDSLLIYGFIKSSMEYNPQQKKYSILQRDVIWDKTTNSYLMKQSDDAVPQFAHSNSNTSLLDKEKNVSVSNDNDESDTIKISNQIMNTIISYYQSPDTVQNWLKILFDKNMIKSNVATSSAVNHYILNNINIGDFILDIFDNFDAQQQNKLLQHYDLGVSHYFTSIKRICHKDFVPSIKDMILMSKCIGTQKSNELKDLKFKGTLYQFINIQPMFKTAVKRWIFQFQENCDGLIFNLPLTSYTQWESKFESNTLIKNFQQITDNHLLTINCSFHLFLTEKNLFKEQIKKDGFIFENYTGNGTYNSSIQFLINYLKGKLIADNKGNKRHIEIHVVSVYDPLQLSVSFAEVATILNRHCLVKKKSKHHHVQTSSKNF